MNNNRTDVFRFMAIREPNKLHDLDSVRIKAHGADEDSSVLLKTIDSLPPSDNLPEEIETIVTDYVNGKLRNATAYTTGVKDLDPKLFELDKIIHGKSIAGTVSLIKDEVERLNITAKDLAGWKKRAGDSFYAALVLRKNRSADLRGIERAIRSLHVISQVKSGSIAHDKSVASALTKTITVSKSIISLRSSKTPKIADNENVKRINENAERVKKAVEEFEGNYAAIKELTAAYDKDWEQRRDQQNEEGEPVTEAQEVPAIYNGAIQKFSRWLGISPVTEKLSIPASEPDNSGVVFQSILADDITNSISEDTKGRLAAVFSSTEKIEASVAITRLEEKNQEITHALHNSPNGTQVAMFGGHAVYNPGSGMGVYVDPGFTHRFTPGACSISATDAPLKKHDFPVTHGRFNSLGVGELQVVKQKLIAYEIGEIAHIENVMASEKRLRNHRKLHRTEEFTSFESERLEETENDLETTTRFELQKAIEKEVQEKTRVEAGLTVTGSYGPSVEFSANAGIAIDNSSAKSESLSTSYSKEVVDRSVHRIQENIKEIRTLLTIDEVEVINEHSFKNQEAGAIHINGVYRWVNKIYEAQVFNYGRRELIEVIIPEPAAFLRYLATNRPKDRSIVSRPLKPGYCVDGGIGFVPLSPGTLTDTNYLDWVSAYNIQDVKPPPPTFTWKTTVLKSDASSGDDDDKTHLTLSILKDDNFTVPSGYVATEAWFCVNLIGITTQDTKVTNKWYSAKKTSITTASTYGDITIGKKTTYIETGKKGASFNPRHVSLDREDGKVPIAASVSSPFPLNATVEVKCRRTSAAWDWKISTFNAIMNSYEILKDEYEESISGDELFGGVDIQGKNPVENQKIILNELKRQVITQLTGQTYDGFDAMQENVAEYGYPQQNVDEAWSEGRYIRFVEQAFEWENLQYLFYPYYWGKKKDWPINSQLEDTDTLFKDFLQAGSCRLNIAVRPGFEDSVNTFLSTGNLPWDSDDDTVLVAGLDTNEEEAIDPFLSITEEIRARQGAVYYKTDGTVSRVAGDPNGLLTGDLVEDIDENGEVVLSNGVPLLVNSTDFVNDDLNREINIAGKIYMITSVDVDQQKIMLDEDVADPNLSKAQYGIGAKAIGVPWMVTIPTSLVILGDGSDLPDIPR